METRFGKITKEAFDSLDYKFFDSSFFKPINKGTKDEYSCILPDGAAGNFAYSDADNGMLVHCYSFKIKGDIKIGVIYCTRSTQYGLPKHGYWTPAAPSLSYAVRNNPKYESSKARNLVKLFSRFMDSPKNLEAVFQQYSNRYADPMI